MLENSVSVELLQQIMKKILDSSSNYYKTLYSRKVNTVQPDILEHFLGEDRIKKLSDKEDWVVKDLRQGMRDRPHFKDT